MGRTFLVTDSTGAERLTGDADEALDEWLTGLAVSIVRVPAPPEKCGCLQCCPEKREELSRV